MIPLLVLLYGCQQLLLWPRPPLLVLLDDCQQQFCHLLAAHGSLLHLS